MRSLLATLLTLSAFGLAACDDDGEVEIDICSDDLDCNDGFICDITDQEDGVCIED